MKKKLLLCPIHRTVLSLALTSWLAPALAWQPLSTGLTGGTPAVNALAIDSSGHLYAGGIFTTAGGSSASNIAKWDGSAWSAVGSGTNGTIKALAVSGSNLFTGGTFTTAGGSTVNAIAKWDGTTWSALNSGVATTNEVDALNVSGTTLYVGGAFTTVGSLPITANKIAKWDINGSSWSQIDAISLKNTVQAIAVNGSYLFAGGLFRFTSDYAATGYVTLYSIGLWNGSAWSGLGSGDPTDVNSPAVGVDTGYVVNALAMNGTDLYAGGSFVRVANNTTPTANRVAKWNGTAWSPLLDGSNNGLSAEVNALVVDASNNKLYAGGSFSKIGLSSGSGPNAQGVARWDITNSRWSRLGADTAYAFNTVSPSSNTVSALTMDIDGNLYAAGKFTTVGEDSAGAAVSANNIAVYTATDLTANQWKLVSLPHYESSGTKISAAFDSLPASSYNVGGDSNGWIVWERDEISQNYVRKRSNTDVLQQGKGYWVKSYADGVMDMDGVETPVVSQATNSNCTSSKGCYIIELSNSDGTNPHYNLLGNPFINRVQWANVRFEIGGTLGNPATGTTPAYTPNGALSAGIADKQFAVYNGSAYQTCDDVTGGCDHYLKPMQGFWVKLLPASHNQVVKLLIPKP
ncbi:MAG: hypothetical protein WAX77_04770 [Methylococcaceae bacterium]